MTENIYYAPPTFQDELYVHYRETYKQTYFFCMHEATCCGSFISFKSLLTIDNYLSPANES